MADMIEPPLSNSFAINSASLGFSACLLFPLAGWLSDKMGRKRVMATGGIMMAVVSPFTLKTIGRGEAVPSFLAQSLMGICLSLWGAPMMAWLAESFEPAARLTSVSIGYNIAQALGGGIAPAIATVMVDTLGSDSPGYYMSVVACIALVGLCFVAPRKPVHFTILQQGDDEGEMDAPGEDLTLT